MMSLQAEVVSKSLYSQQQQPNSHSVHMGHPASLASAMDGGLHTMSQSQSSIPTSAADVFSSLSRTAFHPHHPLSGTPPSSLAGFSPLAAAAALNATSLAALQNLQPWSTDMRLSLPPGAHPAFPVSATTTPLCWKSFFPLSLSLLRFTNTPSARILVLCTNIPVSLIFFFFYRFAGHFHSV